MVKIRPEISCWQNIRCFALTLDKNIVDIPAVDVWFLHLPEHFFLSYENVCWQPSLGRTHSYTVYLEVFIPSGADGGSFLSKALKQAT